jgi:predicted TIM-barrel enzyme
LWIGLNCLDLTPTETFERIPDGVAGVWVDNALIDEGQAAQPAAEAVLTAQQQRNWQGLYFGGVAFKYQTPVDDVALAAQQAAPYMDVITTSGVATGQAADRQKIAAMKSVLGEKPLAIASGISPENVEHYLDVADCFLVATAISQSFSDLDPRRVEALVAVVRAYRPPTANLTV